MEYLKLLPSIKKRNVFLFAFCFSIALLPVWSAANAQQQDPEETHLRGEGTEGTITLGGAFLGLSTDKSDLDRSSKYGHYTGADESGYAIGNVNVSHVGKKFFLDLRASDVGRDSRNVVVEAGKTGLISGYIEYDQIPHMLATEAKTIHDGAESSTLTLPAGFTTAADPAGMATSLAANQKDVDLRIDRRSISGGLLMQHRKFDFKLDIKKETKDGTKDMGSVVGKFSGNRMSMVLPEPIDYTTNEFSALLGYNHKMVNLRLKYYYSTFKNDIPYLTWDNPYSGTTYPTTAITALPPDNEHRRYNITGGLNLAYSTRITALAEWGKMTQNESLLPYTNQDTTITLPRASADAEINTTNLMLGITSRPLRKLNVTARYKQYSTENNTPRDTFLYIRNDGTVSDDQAALTSAHALNNLPFDYTQKKIDLNATYNILKRTNIKLGYINEKMERAFREVRETTESTYKIGLNTRYSQKATVRLNVSLSERTADDTYDASKFYDEYHTQEYIATITDTDMRFINNPQVRKYDIADRDKTAFNAKFTVYPSSLAEVGFYYDSITEDFKNSTLGLEESATNYWTIDVTAFPTESLTVNAYYTREEISSKQTGRYFGGNYSDTSSVLGVADSSQYLDTTRNWKANHYDDIPTIGLRVDLMLLDDSLKIEGDVMVQKATTSIQFNAGSTLTPPTDLPEVETNLAMYSLTASYDLTDEWKLSLGYKYEDYETKDFATDGLDPMTGTLAQVITMTGTEPDYTAHLGMVYVTYSFSNLKE